MTAAVVTYLLIGLLFAVVFAVVGYRKIDPAATGAPWTVRLIWLPAALALWPILIWRWKQVGGATDEQGASEESVA